VFYLGAAFYVFGTIIYVLFGSGEVQEWAKPKQTEELKDVDEKEALAKEREKDKEKEIEA